MYVPGKLKSCEKVLVDIGTGYYVEKVGSQCCVYGPQYHACIHVFLLQTTKEADEFYQRKLDYVVQNIERMQKAMVEKHKMRECKLA
jgi:prefoldin alpha subunit